VVELALYWEYGAVFNWRTNMKRSIKNSLWIDEPGSNTATPPEELIEKEVAEWVSENDMEHCKLLITVRKLIGRYQN
jgi:hypothetical protein